MNLSEAKFLCVSYDIPDNKRRNRIWKILKRYGIPVQYSFFECWLTARQTESLREDLAKVVTGEDRIRFYDLCRACHRETTVLGNGRKTQIEESYIF